MKPRVAFIPTDQNNMKYAQMCINSLRKFHSEEELPIVIIDEEKVKQIGDPHFWYRATPIVAKGLMKDYETIIKLDADQIVCGDLSHIWTGEDFDVAVVNNSNPREDKVYPIRLMDIHPLSYVNCGLVVLKSKTFNEHWFKLCFSDHFYNFQYREQDLLNILVFYSGENFGGPYKVKFLDNGDSFHGLASKGYWPDIILKDGELILPANEEWNKEDKKIKVLHWAGGHVGKMNYRLNFRPEIIKRLDELVK